MSCVIESDEELEMEMLKVSASGFIFQFFSNDAALGSQWSGAVKGREYEAELLTEDGQNKHRDT